jgi:hypothetical protein
MAENIENKNWWTTLPGIITALATLITAIGGLLVILNSNGYLSHKKEADSNSKTENAASDAKVDKNKMPVVSEKETATISNIKTSTLKGNVGKLQVVFNLTFNSVTKKIQGSYYYPARKNVVYEITGIILPDGIELTEFTSDVKTATCTLNNAGNCYNGRMYNNNGKQFDMNICKTDN